MQKEEKWERRHQKKKKRIKQAMEKQEKKLEKQMQKPKKKKIIIPKIHMQVKIGDITRKRRMRVALVMVVVLFVGLAGRIGYLQLVKGPWLKEMAEVQQSLDRKINPKRGTIFDATGKKVLAVSSTVNTVTVTPVNIAKEDKEKVAHALAELFELDYETVLKKVTKRSSIETIVKKVEKEKTDALREWMMENNITAGINIDEDTKRYYPYNNLASQIIGFCGSDNQGLDGIEAIYEEELKGSAGQISKLTDARGGEIDGKAEEYTDAIDGNDVVLTIDATIQGIAEKYLKEACIDNVCTDGGNIVIMDPNNGDILAIAGYPNYNLNDPYTPNTEELAATWSDLPQSERTKALQQMWRNKAISDTYEPGSTFKLITASAALEEGITTTDKAGEFCCTGGIEVAGVRMKCWRYYRPHGPESLRDALMNSCNPVFIGLGQKLGVSTYYKYLEKFGYLKKTGIDLPGEARSIFLAENKVGPVELGTISFGQRFEVTPIQMVTAVSAIANGGDYVKPRIVKQIINSQTGEVRDIETIREKGVISQETANNVLSMMETVVAVGTGKNAQVQGYSIGGKTGTSEDGVNTGKYVTSFLGVAPISDPQVVILITLYNPTGEGGHQGGGVAAPIGGQVLSEVLPYLQVAKDNQTEEEQPVEVEVPNITGKTVQEAKEMLKEVGLEMEADVEFTNEQVIAEQLPKAGISLRNDNKVWVRLQEY